ncbi:ABC transporter ATP-binding protein [Carnobacteriaceae bacterium zg-ZUI78]|nr:ABC transporter ATP-binding protein [Carnobacteriaceae bacterium zg-ZUI78]
MEKLVVDALSVQIGDTVLLNHIDIDLTIGKALIIIGESGSGKTLLTKMIIGQVPKQAIISGKILYKGLSLLDLSKKEWQVLRGTKIAYMVQNPMAMFNPFQKIKVHFLETILSHDKMSKEGCLDKAIQAMKDVRLGHPQDVLEKYPFELSGGMLQRVMLAILLCLNTDTIILDEPTSALDAYNRDNIVRLLKMLLEKGKTLITVTHDYDLAHALGGEMLVMYKGDIVERGFVEDVLENPQHPYTQELVLGNPYERLVNEHD